MYSDWISLQSDVKNIDKNQSVLHTVPSIVEKEVSISMVNSLAQNLMRRMNGEESSPLKTDKQVRWAMEVMCFGLSLPLSEHDAIRACVHVYCEWMTALTTPKACVPQPIVHDPEAYIIDLLNHLCNLFVPRMEQTVDRQAVLCHRVLRTVQKTLAESKIQSPQLWKNALVFLMSASDSLLGPPSVPEGLGEHLGVRVLGVLLDVWLMACEYNFPSPSLWKTLMEMISQWRHHEALIIKWQRVTMLLTDQVLRYTHSPEFPRPCINDEDSALIGPRLSQEHTIQAWFRILQILGNPVDLCRPEVIGNTPKFLHHALTSKEVVEPKQNECLTKLPEIFLQAMRAVVSLTDAFLGVTIITEEVSHEMGSLQRHAASFQFRSTTPPRRQKTLSFAANSAGLKATKSPIQGTTFPAKNSAVPPTNYLVANFQLRSACSPHRSSINSVLHLFGAWLFEGSLIGVRVHGVTQAASQAAQRRRSSTFLSQRLTRSASAEEGGDPDGDVNWLRYEAGRAEVCGALCRIFCSHQTNEAIDDEYLSSFYLMLHYGLAADQTQQAQVMVNILLNSSDLLRCDLPGVSVLLPSLFPAIHAVLSERSAKPPPAISPAALRRAAIHVLLSTLSWPNYFQNLKIKPLLHLEVDEALQMTFLTYLPRLKSLLLEALSFENDPINSQMLLGGILLLAQDISEHQAQSDLHCDPGLLTELFEESVAAVCHNLLATWKLELGLALSAIEVLGGLAQLRLHRPALQRCKDAVRWLCELINYQCSRPAPAHSKDLHSMIVAAFVCIATWVVEHEELLLDRDSLKAVLEVVELGISGSKSQVKLNEPVTLKGNKELKPVSLRVKDVAENLLTIVMNHVGNFPLPCGPESLSSVLDEENLLRHCKLLRSSKTSFLYFVIDGGTILALLEQPLGESSGCLPTVTALVRGPSGRYAWTSQLRLVPSRDSSCTARSTAAARPAPGATTKTPRKSIPRIFPASADDIATVKADASLPSLDSTMSEQQSELEKIQALICEHAQPQQATSDSQVPAECKPPPNMKQFQAARLFLSHYSFLSFDSFRSAAAGPSPSLFMLDSSLDGFPEDLKQLDKISPRAHCTVFVFSVAKGQRKASAIIRNVNHISTVSKGFLNFVGNLGWAVEISNHSGWAGSYSSSWNVPSQDSNGGGPFPQDTGGAIYDGRLQVLYWADVMSELVFVVPSAATMMKNSSSVSPVKVCSGGAGGAVSKPANPPKTLSLKPSVPSAEQIKKSPISTPADGSATRRARASTAAAACEPRVMIVWLEDFSDMASFPAEKLAQRLPVTHEQTVHGRDVDSPLYILFLHPLSNGLIRVAIKSTCSRMTVACPLVDGMVVNPSIIGHLVRQTIVNTCRRRCLDSDVYQPGHVRRKGKIKDLIEKYKKDLDVPEFYLSLFKEAN